MRGLSAHRGAWILSGAIAVIVAVLKWGTGDLTFDWLLRAVGIGLSSALLAAGLWLRQRTRDERLMNRILAELESRPIRETHSLRE